MCGVNSAVLRVLTKPATPIPDHDVETVSSGHSHSKHDIHNSPSGHGDTFPPNISDSPSGVAKRADTIASLEAEQVGLTASSNLAQERQEVVVIIVRNYDHNRLSRRGGSG